MSIFRLIQVAAIGVVASTPTFGQTPKAAVSYYPGVDVVQISVIETQTATKTVEDNGSGFVLKRKTTTKREGTVALKTVADVARARTIDLQSRGLTDTTFAVELSDDGLLRGVNLASVGRFGDFLASIAKFAGLLFVAPGAAATPETRTTPCDGHSPQFASLPVNARYFVEQSTPGCSLARQVLADQQRVQQHESELRKAEDQMIGAPSTEVPNLQKRIETLRTSYNESLKAFAARTENFARALQQFEQEQELGTTSLGQVTRSEILRLEDLLQEDPQKGPPISDGATIAQVETALSNHTAALDVFRRSRIAVTIGALPGNLPKVSDATSGEKNVVEVCFRQSVPLRLRVFLVKATVEEADQAAGVALSASAPRARQVSHNIENVLHPQVGLTCPTFKTSAFADRKLTLTFDIKGRPQKIDRQGKSDAAAVAASLANAASAFRDEYAASLKKLEEIQASRRAIDLNDLTTRAERLKREKAVIDAQLELEGRTATFDAALQRQKLQADLDALNADIQLATVEDFRAQRQEIEQLKLTLEQMQRTLELVKAEQELEKARNK